MICTSNANQAKALARSLIKGGVVESDRLLDCPTDPDFINEEVLFVLHKAPTKQETLQFFARLQRKVLLIAEKLPPEFIAHATKEGEFLDLSAESESARNQRMRQMIQSRLEKPIDPAALEILLTVDEAHLEREMDKLLCYCDGETIREEDVRAVVHSPVKAHRFALLDALEANDSKRALSVALKLGQEEELFSLVRMVRNRLQQLLVVQQLATAADVKTFLPAVNERAIHRLMQTAARLPHLEQALASVDRLEWHMRDGLADPRTILAMLVTGVCR